MIKSQVSTVGHTHIYISYIYLSSGILVITHKRQGNPTFLSRSLRHLLPSHPCGLWPCPALLLRNPKRMAKRSQNTINLGSKIRVLPGCCGFCMISIFPTFWGFSKDDVKLRPPNSARKVWWHLMTWVYASVSGQYPVWRLFLPSSLFIFADLKNMVSCRYP
jgi:hypothetical protein